MAIKEASAVTLLLYPEFLISYNVLCCFRLILCKAGITAALPCADRQTLVIVRTVKKSNDLFMQ